MNESAVGLPPPLARRLLAPVATSGAVVAAFAYVAVVDPNQPGHYPVCPLLRLTGVYCPGCGGLRAAHAIAHGDFVAALGLNVLAVAVFLGFAVFLGVWFSRAARGRRTSITIRPVHWWLIGGVTALFMIVRNLPFGAVLAP